MVLRRPPESTSDAAVAVMHEASALHGLPVLQRLLEGIEDEPGMGSPRHPPADDPPREGVDDEGDVDKALPCRDVRSRFRAKASKHPANTAAA